MTKYETKKLQEQLRAKNRTIVDKEEYAALVALRDGAHEELKIKMTHMQDRFADLLGVNAEQLARLQRASLETDGLRTNLKRLEDRDRLLTDRVTKLEVELAHARGVADENAKLKAELEQVRARIESAYPARFSTPQPAFGGSK